MIPSLAEEHDNLSVRLDLTAGRLADGVHHAQRAPESIGARLVKLPAGFARTLPSLPPNSLTQVSTKASLLYLLKASPELEAIRRLRPKSSDKARCFCVFFHPNHVTRLAVYLAPNGRQAVCPKVGTKRA